jgi:hypothetical protein
MVATEIAPVGAGTFPVHRQIERRIDRIGKL